MFFIGGLGIGAVVGFATGIIVGMSIATPITEAAQRDAEYWKRICKEKGWMPAT